ncbi:hypothetical protein HDF16_004895 [Granulicella aggregans]|uniref:Uncharacterized protein n=1 Tax=Granulicella aggregans TaxID=474949 RepID=A0A7W7ZHQ2_9BACT|nr:hypothetical protein [Granulicella aggregans]
MSQSVSNASHTLNPKASKGISMSQLKFKFILAAISVGSVVQLAGCSSMQTAKAAEAPSLVGTWQVQISLKDCVASAPLGQPFQSLLSFAQGGTMTETTSNPGFFPAVRSPGHGNWSATGDRLYTASTVAYITLNGVLAKTQTITQTTIQMTGDDTFQTPSASVKFYGPDSSPPGLRVRRRKRKAIRDRRNPSALTLRITCGSRSSWSYSSKRHGSPI